MTNNRQLLIGMLIVPIALAGIGVAVASTVATPNTFTAGTTAVAAQVNANFAAHQAAINDNAASLPQVFAQLDSDAGGVSEVGTGQKEINSINVNLPSSGVLVISGCCFINPGAAGTYYTMQPKLDGANVLPNSDAAFHESTPGTELFSLSYTLSVAVTAGAHVVSQTVGPSSGTASFFHNREAFTVQFIPTGTVTDTPSAP